MLESLLNASIYPYLKLLICFKNNPTHGSQKPQLDNEYMMYNIIGMNIIYDKLPNSMKDRRFVVLRTRKFYSYI